MIDMNGEEESEMAEATTEQTETAPCHFCKQECDRAENYCYGCGKVICENCAVNWDMPMGSHPPGLHRVEPEE